MKRRNFITAAALGSASIVGSGTSILTGCAPSASQSLKLLTDEELNLPPLLKKASEGRPLRFGLIGCGGRGSGAAMNLLNAGDGLSVVAIADCLPDKLESARAALNKRGQNITPEQAFLGFDAWKKVLESPIDGVIIAIPSRYHPQMFEGAIQAGKHVFVEKPCAVDAAGVRKFMMTARTADQKKLSVVCGTQRRHQTNYRETFRRVASGMIGDIVGGACYWMTGRTGYVNRRPEWTDTEYLLRNWLNYPFMGGDCIVDHHIHNLDVVSWFLGNKAPKKAIGFGAKIRPSLGCKYDIYSVHYEYDNGVIIASGTRHIDQCTSDISEYLLGTKGKTNCYNTIWDLQGNVIWKHEPEKNSEGKVTERDAYDQEHIDWVTSIRTNKPLNDAHDMARSTLIAIMGRDSAWTGKTISWDEILTSDYVLGPEVQAMGKVDYSDEHPLPGIPSLPS